MDRGADGWELGNSFIIINQLAHEVASGTLGSAVPDDFLKRVSFCLPVGKYEMILLTLGDDFNEMTIAVDDCATYLAGGIQAHTSGELDVVMDTSGDFSCNPCGGASVPLLLVGSLYGVPYGWAEGVTYQVLDSRNVIIAEGTMGTGMFEERHLCLADGEYSLYFNIPIDASDDLFEDDDYYGNQYGIEEYLMQLNGGLIIDADSAIAFEVLNGEMTNGTAVFPVKTDDVGDDDAVTELVIIIVVAIVVFVCCIIFVLFAMGILFCAREKPLTREEVEARYRADIEELMRVENPLQAGQTPASEPGEDVKSANPTQPVGSRFRRVSITMAKRFSNFDTPDWKAKVTANSTPEFNPDASL
jgi:hypothetical protein